MTMIMTLFHTCEPYKHSHNHKPGWDMNIDADNLISRYTLFSNSAVWSTHSQFKTQNLFSFIGLYIIHPIHPSHHPSIRPLIHFSHSFISSHYCRYHNIGLIVLYLHDISDIFLESTKILLCFKSAPGRQQAPAGYLVNLGFLSFTFSW